MRGNCFETPIRNGQGSTRQLNIKEASMAIMSSMQGKHRLPTQLYTESKVVNHSTAGTMGT